MAALAIVTVLTGCEVWHAPTRPTEVTMAPPPRATLSVATSTASAAVAWRCFAATPFLPAECGSIVSSRAHGAAVGAALSAPSSPTGLAGVVSDNTVRLTWIAPAGGEPPTSFVIEAGSASGLADIATFDSASAATSLRVDNVPAGTYFVRVRSKNAAGTGGPSNEVAVTVAGGTTCIAAPGAPSGLSATVTDRSVRLEWVAPSGGCAATSYILDVGSSSGSNNVASVNTGSTATIFSADAVPFGTYFARVRAANAALASGSSNEARFTIETVVIPCVAPSAPTGGAAAVSGTTVRLTWAAGTGVPTSYIVELGTAPGESNISSTDTGSSSTSLATTLTPGTYFIRIRAKNACGTGNPSNEVTVTVVSVTVPTTITISSSGVSPKNLTISPGTRVTFVNNDRIDHDVASDPHPEHTDCLEINQVGFLVPGQSRQTGNLNTVRVCGYHDHNQPTNSTFQGTITIR